MSKHISLWLVALLAGLLVTGVSYFVQTNASQGTQCAVATGRGPLAELGAETRPVKQRGLPLAYYREDASDQTQGCYPIDSKPVATSAAFQGSFFVADAALWTALASIGIWLYHKRKHA